MAKSLLKIKSVKLRKKGASVGEIAAKLGVAKSTVSIWTRDIVLTEAQAQELKKRELKGKEIGRTRGSLVQKQKRIQKMNKMMELGKKDFPCLKEDCLFVSGLSLYWAEGSKKNSGIQFCNSDPKMIKIIISWFRKYFDIKLEEIHARVGINEIHKGRESVVRRFWREATGIPSNQFTKTSFKKVLNKKIYENHDEHFGTLSLTVLKPGRIYYKILGLIEGLKTDLAG